MSLLIIFLIGLTSSFIGSFFSGVTSLIALTALIATGMSPLIAFSTFRIGVLGFELGGLLSYQKDQKVVWNLFIPLTVTGVIGSILGALWLVSIDETLIVRVVGFAILLFIPLSLINHKLGIENVAVRPMRRWAGHIASFIVALWGGSFAVGIGFFSVFKSMYFYGLTLLEAKASSKLPAFISSLCVMAVFWFNDFIQWDSSFALMGGMLIGGFIGAKYSVKVGDKCLKFLLLVTIALFATKYLLGY